MVWSKVSKQGAQNFQRLLLSVAGVVGFLLEFSDGLYDHVASMEADSWGNLVRQNGQLISFAMSHEKIPRKQTLLLEKDPVWPPQLLQPVQYSARMLRQSCANQEGLHGSDFSLWKKKRDIGRFSNPSPSTPERSIPLNGSHPPAINSA